MLNSTISMSYPDVVIACIEHKVSLNTRAIEAALVKHDNNMKDYSLVASITITANHSNYFSLWQSQHAVCHCQKVKLQTQIYWQVVFVIKWIYNIVPTGGKNAGCSFFITFNWCICSLFLFLFRTAGFNDPGWEIPGPFFAQERC